jgi:hypothetical protein
MVSLNTPRKRPRFGYVVLCIAAALLTLPSAHADEASKRAKVEKLLSLSKIDVMIGQVAGQMTASFNNASAKSASKPGFTQAALDKLNANVDGMIHDAFSVDHLKPAMVQAYMDTYTEDELDGIIAFYLSPAGKAFVAKSPQVSQRENQILRQQAAELQPKVQAATQEFEAGLSKSAAPKK